MSSNDFLEFDDDAQTQESSSSRSPFVILVGALITILILASICTVYLLSQRNQGNGEEVAAIETQNAIIAVTNEAVTQTIAAMETENAQPPTETPTPSPVAIEPPTETPTIPPTDTPVTQTGEVEGGETGGEIGEGEAAETGEAVVDTGNGEEGDGTETDTTTQGDGSTTVGSTPTAAFGTTGTDSALPQTGLDTWTAILLALFFIGLFVASRRLRSR